ncbi:MarR family winged helix-turn-helix transcriptional regulator [Geodermatophilus sp. CPCC 206100]|uniref:MarR family winged helix-turn-helix transcriptional regulator n=1 Tax=Geodermatophilus sp. CPCC 206100 TaxID=3020054 RepID=UPI003AFF91AC
MRAEDDDSQPAAGSSDATVGQMLRRLHQRQSRVLDLGQIYGLTRPQFSVLGAVVGVPGVDQRGVTTATFVDKSTVADIVTRLAEKQLLVVSRNPDDLRRDELRPTPAAIALVYESAPLILEGNERVLSPIPLAQREEFLQLLRATAHAGRTEVPKDYVNPSPDGVRPPINVHWGLGRLLRGSLQRHGRLWSRHVPAVTHVQWLALSALLGGTDIDQRTLGELISLDKASLTDMLDRLARRRLVRKLRDPADGRRRVLRVTEEGRDLLDRVAPLVREVDADYLEPLGPEQRSRFVRGLRRLVEADADDGGAPAGAPTLVGGVS